MHEPGSCNCRARASTKAAGKTGFAAAGNDDDKRPAICSQMEGRMPCSNLSVRPCSQMSQKPHGLGLPCGVVPDEYVPSGA